MDNLSEKFNKMLLQEVGLDIQTDGTLIDQDMGIPIRFDGIPVVGPDTFIQRGENSVIPFDPYNNTRMMNFIFNHFMSKMTEMGEIDHFDVVFNEDSPAGGGVVTIRNESAELSSSRPYVRESCKYADLIYQLNGDDVPDMKEFDIPKSVQKDMIRKDREKHIRKPRVKK